MILNYPTEFAVALAMFAQKKLSFAKRGALLIHCTGDGNVVAAVFGNDHYLSDSRAQREVEVLRHYLKDAVVEELGFGLSQDGMSWALLVKGDSTRLHTRVGKAFQLEMLRAFLSDAVEGSWHAACGTEPIHSPRPIFEKRHSG